MNKQDSTKLIDNIWNSIREEAREFSQREPVLTSFLYDTILNQKSFAHSLSFHLSNKLDSIPLPSILLREIFLDVLEEDCLICTMVCKDLWAIKARDPAAKNYSTPFLYYKGFHALQSYRIAHCLWQKNRKEIALYLQNRISEVFAVDIHPAATIGAGILIDHATSVVIGETAEIGDNVSILHEVTLGGTGKESGDRHPKIKQGVLIGAGAKILGNITVGEGTKVGAGSVVLNHVPAHVTVAGIPAKIIGKPLEEEPALEMDHRLFEEKTD